MTSLKLLVAGKLPEELWNNLPPQFFVDVDVDSGNRRKVALVFEGVC